ncbi:AraC family transcriptional regulator ligand-binding domain-containing protein [Streptomyces sp. ME02-8801-2C]|uniref:AraC family transcriptional regulator n=1 Tax=Streptomyces sp. ME02-8801-2C TaxID=3028680 RepID=UPI0029A62072|nr:AraC family transcriptional regulator ligand-binding domain-containing protein [Streptomyces sp. ME02-8801-2C]MDX3452058.1 AraC family transcriptional regulator ligand-binding domain-containing protein [Streptomyces sp. ME02-8801-2C]
MRDSDLPVRASALRGLTTLVSAVGGPGPELLAAYGFDEAEIVEGNSFVSLRLVERVLEQAASQFELPDLGLRMAAQQDLHMLGPLAIAMENSGTIGEALGCASRYLFVYSPAISLEETKDPLGSPGVIGLRYASKTMDTSPQSIDYGIAIVHRFLTLINGDAPYGLRSVQLPHARLAPESAYREHFGAEVRFDCPSAVLRVTSGLLSMPVSGGNALLRDIAIGYLDTHFGHKDLPISDLVAAILSEQHGSDYPDLSKVARLLSLHPRSLQRSLSEEGTTFTGVVDRVRRSQALDLITTTNLSFSQIAARLGMHEQSSLTRAVRRWFDTSPSGLRHAGQEPKKHSASIDSY